MKPYRLASFVFFLIAALAACGGGGGYVGTRATPTPAPTATPAPGPSGTVQTSSSSSQTVNLATGGTSAAITIPPATSGSATLTLTASTTFPSGVSPLARRRPAVSCSATFAGFYLTITANANVTLTGAFDYAITLPAGTSTSGVNFYIAFLQPGASAWQEPGFPIVGSVNGQTVTFDVAGQTAELLAGETYRFALYSEPSSCPTPSPAASSSPTPAPTASPTVSPSGSPTTSPTPTTSPSSGPATFTGGSSTDSSVQPSGGATLPINGMDNGYGGQVTLGTSTASTPFSMTMSWASFSQISGNFTPGALPSNLNSQHNVTALLYFDFNTANSVAFTQTPSFQMFTGTGGSNPPFPGTQCGWAVYDKLSGQSAPQWNAMGALSGGFDEVFAGESGSITIPPYPIPSGLTFDAGDTYFAAYCYSPVFSGGSSTATYSGSGGANSMSSDGGFSGSVTFGSNNQTSFTMKLSTATFPQISTPFLPGSIPGSIGTGFLYLDFLPSADVLFNQTPGVQISTGSTGFPGSHCGFAYYGKTGGSSSTAQWNPMTAFGLSEVAPVSNGSGGWTISVPPGTLPTGNTVEFKASDSYIGLYCH